MLNKQQRVMLTNNLFEKYNKPVPRYTSYPAVPHWEEERLCKQKWRLTVKEAFKKYNEEYGMSLYIHLPYCESLCTYCGCNTRITVNHKVEVPYITTLLKEFDMYCELFGTKPKLKEIHLGGGTPTFFSPANLKFLLSEIQDRCIVEKEVEFSFEAHPANTSKEHLEELRKLGFKRLSLGIQDFDPEIQRIINRKQSFEDVNQVVENARHLWYNSVNFDIVYGLPKQTIESVQDTIDKVLELKPERIAYYSYAHVPWKHKGQRAYDETDLPTNEEKRKLYELGKKAFLAAGYEEIGMDHFALPSDDLALAKSEKQLHRNFMGYVPMPSKFLLGLGVSSISDVGLGYAQNVKSVEGYQEQVEAGRLAVFKGHFMTGVDQVTKEAVTEIMCNEQVKASLISTLPFELKSKIYDKLHELESDGLIELGEIIKVKEDGKKFVRNIASAFDYRILESENEHRFSMSI